MSRIIPELTPEQREALIVAARSMLGTPFRHQGRTLKAMDCIGFLGFAVGMATGQRLQPRTDYGRVPAHKKLQRELTAHLGAPLALDAKAAKFDVQPGQIVTCKWFVEANHVAIVTPHQERGVGLIHCYLASQKVVEHGLDALWRSRITGVWQP